MLDTEKNPFYSDATSFMKIGKIDDNVRNLMGELEETIPWREWSLSTIWRCNDVSKCEALIQMLEERKKNIEMNIMMDKAVEENMHKNAPILEEIHKVQIEEIQKIEKAELEEMN